MDSIRQTVVLQYDSLEPDPLRETKRWMASHGVKWGYKTSANGLILQIKSDPEPVLLDLEHHRGPPNLRLAFVSLKVVGNAKVYHGPAFDRQEQHLRDAPGANMPLNSLNDDLGPQYRNRMTRVEYARAD